MKYIVEFSFQYEDLFDTVQYSVETPLCADDVKHLIEDKSRVLEDIKNGPKRSTDGNVVYLKSTNKEQPLIDTKGNVSQQFRNLATLQFDRGKLIVPLGLLPETIIIFTPEEWFDYCLVE